MAATASSSYTLACNVCDICRKRGRQIEYACRCLECALSLCPDCSFVHSCILACQTHATIPAGAEDVHQKSEVSDNVDEFWDTKDRKTKILASVDVFPKTDVSESVEVLLNTRGSHRVDMYCKTEIPSVDVYSNTEGQNSVDVYRNTESQNSEDVYRRTESRDGNEREEGYPQFRLHSKFNPAREEDEVKPEIRAVLLLECGVILATDLANCSLKSFDMDGRFLGDCFFDKSGKDAGRIHGVTMKDAKTVYVTLPSFNMIASISVERISDVVLTPTRFDTKRRYFGIAHMATNETLIVGTTNAVDVLSYQCQVIRHLERFSKPYNMGTESPGSVLAADTENNCLYRIGADDTVERIDVGKRKRQLRGVAVDRRGNIFFAAVQCPGVGCARDGEPIKWVLTDRVQKAVGVHCQQINTDQWLVVSEEDGTIKVFSIK